MDFSETVFQRTNSLCQVSLSEQNPRVLSPAFVIGADILPLGLYGGKLPFPILSEILFLVCSCHPLSLACCGVGCGCFVVPFSSCSVAFDLDDRIVDHVHTERDSAGHNPTKENQEPFRSLELGLRAEAEIYPGVFGEMRDQFIPVTWIT